MQSTIYYLQQQEMDEFMGELDEDVEGMQSTIYYLQQQLREARETIAKLETQVGGEKSDERVKAENDDDDEKMDVKKESFDSPSRRGENIEREKEESRQATPVKSEEEENEGSTRQATPVKSEE